MMLELASIWKPEVQQQNYRSILEAMSRPGRIQNITFSQSDSDAMTAILATLLDGEVSLSDPDKLLNIDDWPMLQATKAEPDCADYIVCKGSSSPDFEPKQGTLSSPEYSATLLLQVESLTSGSSKIRLQGPGIETSEEVSISGLSDDWLTRREDWVYAFPLGVDMILVAQDMILALPRTTRLEVI
ncbi:phosphonate C-P lyase system protein PhnH [uncultured Neptuniibacter sp.]|uniref:phosphonate C-P lyase system protein PhnH n=1 Tax=uncultured Neptuniibacter sp. TaxID=502143 RepID=UPI002630E5AD|nr:phosphonate C-P lyase system protein PhnH [uncultured Neptuniibacter sp.]